MELVEGGGGRHAKRGRVTPMHSYLSINPSIEGLMKIFPCFLFVLAWNYIGREKGYFSLRELSSPPQFEQSATSHED